jgi:hypothetical protein
VFRSNKVAAVAVKRQRQALDDVLGLYLEAFHQETSHTTLHGTDSENNVMAGHKSSSAPRTTLPGE